jgi:hypothetical protein
MPLTVKYGPQNVGGKTVPVTVPLVVTASSAYTTGYQVGQVINFASIFDNGPSGIIQSAYLTSKSVQTAGFKLYPFSQNPTNSTWGDKTAPAIVAADIPFICGAPIVFWSSDSGLNSSGMTLYGVPVVGMAVSSSLFTSTSLYGILVTTGTPTFSTTSDLSITLVMLQD